MVPVTAVVEQERGRGYVFYRVKRKGEAEEKVRKFLSRIVPQPNSLTPWDHIDREKALTWLSDHVDALQKQGVEIIQPEEDISFNLIKPSLELLTQEAGDWFDIKAIVSIGAYHIPFIKFRKHILNGQREYKLPDGSLCILPENWFYEYYHLMEVSKESQ